jgi:hypothetical protein
MGEYPDFCGGGVTIEIACVDNLGIRGGIWTLSPERGCVRGAPAAAAGSPAGFEDFSSPPVKNMRLESG